LFGHVVDFAGDLTDLNRYAQNSEKYKS
jgi:hypothetical protein